MESTERHVRTWIASGREDDITELVQGAECDMHPKRLLLNQEVDISGGRATLLDVVKALGEYLTSEEDVIRSKGEYPTAEKLSGAQKVSFQGLIYFHG